MTAMKNRKEHKNDVQFWYKNLLTKIFWGKYENHRHYMLLLSPGGASDKKEDPFGKGMAVYSTILAWRIPRTEESEGLQFIGLQRAGHN